MARKLPPPPQRHGGGLLELVVLPRRLYVPFQSANHARLPPTVPTVSTLPHSTPFGKEVFRDQPFRSVVVGGCAWNDRERNVAHCLV